MDITLAEIERWANTSELDDRFEQLFDEHQDFDDVILASCDDATLLRFAANRNSSRRRFFASGLVGRLVPALYAHHGLPYEFSRFSGLISFDDFKNREIDRLKRVYDACKTVETMRTSPQEEIKNVGDMILDYRHDRQRPHANTTKLFQLLNYHIQLSYRPGVTSYIMRICEYCNDGFKSWIESGVEIESTKCPFCTLKLQYPQKTGRNAG
ncbi:MAG: hypothetical protein R3C53_27890 [Pirellulaceae bacterium]